MKRYVGESVMGCVSSQQSEMGSRLGFPPAQTQRGTSRMAWRVEWVTLVVESWGMVSEARREVQTAQRVTKLIADPDKDFQGNKALRIN